MGIWESFFKQTQSKSDFGNKLHEKVVSLMPDTNEKDQLYLACIAGLFARVAYVDLEIHPDEKKHMIQVLQKWGNFNEEQAVAITTLSLEHIKELSGLENHRYCVPLSENLATEERHAIVKSLFALASADGSVDNNESEEIRSINKGLLLEHKHFVSARAQVMDKLSALKK